MKKNRFKRIALRTTVFVTGLIITVLALSSPIAKYLIEHYGEKYTNRKIKTDWVYLNPFTGHVYISNPRISESESAKLFFFAKGIELDLSLGKMFSKTYEINKLVLHEPRGIVIQNKKKFNFDDLVNKFKPDSSAEKKAPLHFNVLNIKIDDGKIYYIENEIPVHYYIKELNFESSGKRWNEDTIRGNFSFLSGPSTGDVKANFTIDLKKLDYYFSLAAHKYDLKIFEQYLKDLANYGNFSANLDADLKGSGNFKNEEAIDVKGMWAVNELHLGKTAGDDYLSFKKLKIVMNELNPLEKKYLFDSVLLTKPYFKYERYDHLDNLEMMFGKKGANIKAVKADQEKFNLIIEIADYIKVITKNFLRGDYKINRLSVHNGELRYNDYSISEKFSVALQPFSLHADSVDKNKNWVHAVFETGVRPYGNVAVRLSMNPKDSSDFDLVYKLQKLPAAVFNPYLITYTSFPLDRGTIEMHGAWNVRKGVIKSDNHFLVIDPRITKRLRKKDAKWVPLPLIMAFIRERGNVIDYDIPISGNLKNPKFHLKDVIVDLLENIFVKPPTTPYRLEVRNIENEIEKSHNIQWPMRGILLTDGQQKYLHKVADFLKTDLSATISVYPILFADKEKEYILFFEAKKKYFLLSHNKNKQSFTPEDSLCVEKMSSKDSSFVSYLNKLAGKKEMFTIQQKCSYFIGNSIVQKKFGELLIKREQIFRQYFTENGSEKRVKIHKSANTIPYNGFSFFKIKYKGAVPSYLTEAYADMNKLDEEVPRAKYKEDRKKAREDRRGKSLKQQ